MNSQPIKLQRQATSFLQIPQGREGKFVAFLNGDDTAAGSLTGHASNDSLKQLRDELRSLQSPVIIFGSELQGADISALVKFGSTLNARFICLGDYANSRGAADMGLYPDLLPGYTAMNSGQKFADEWGSLPSEKGLSVPEMAIAAKEGRLSALLTFSASPGDDLTVELLDEAAAIADALTYYQDQIAKEAQLPTYLRCPPRRLMKRPELSPIRVAIFNY